MGQMDRIDEAINRAVARAGVARGASDHPLIYLTELGAGVTVDEVEALLEHTPSYSSIHKICNIS